MNIYFSIYLDLIRFLAAIFVVIYHANVRYLSTDILPLSNHGHIAVIFFFVLSGYVIAYITDIKENRISLYWSSRLSRIYSVALPVIIITPLLDMVGAHISQLQIIYHNNPNDWWLVRIIASVFFLNEIWFNSIMSFSNTPFWSLCYEMSYYLIFSLAIFLKGKAKWWALCISCLIIGPKILLLFPVWLMGVFLHHSNTIKNISTSSSWALFITSATMLTTWEYFDISNQISAQLKILVGTDFHNRLAFSKYFIGDWALGILIFMNFAAFRAIASQFSILLNPLKGIIRYAASFTLTLYLFHQPLIQFYAALIAGETGNIIYFWQTMGATMLTIFILGHLTEHKREKVRHWLRIKLLTLEEHPIIQRITT